MDQFKDLKVIGINIEKQAKIEFVVDGEDAFNLVKLATYNNITIVKSDSIVNKLLKLSLHKGLPKNIITMIINLLINNADNLTNKTKEFANDKRLNYRKN